MGQKIMAAPTPYTLGYSFTNFQTNNPTTPLPGNRVDIELMDVSTSIASLITGLGDVRRSDGALQNGIVTPESLSTSTSILSQDWNLRGDWATATDYAANDAVGRNGATYVCVVAHTSDDFDTDYAAGYWLLIANPPQALGDILFKSFSGDGATTSFNLTVSLTDEKQVQVFVGGGVISPEDYTVSGTNIIFDTAPALGTDNVLVFGADLTTVSSMEAAEAAATAAEAAQSAAELAEVGAEGALASFTEKYLGAYASDAAAETAAGGSPVDGASYWNTSSTVVRVYDDNTSTWYDSTGDVTMSSYFYSGFSGGETSVSGADDDGKTLTYTPGLATVFKNGIKLVNGRDCDVTSGSSVTGLSALLVTDEIEVQVMSKINIADALKSSENLSDLTSASAARNNMGLGSAATEDAESGSGPLARVSSIPAAAYPPGFVYNARVTINSTDSEHDLDVPQFSLRNDANDANIDAGSALTKQFDVTFAEGDGAGGMASGQSMPVSGTFYVFAVTKDLDGTVDVMGDVSSAGANINSGWTAQRLLAVVDTDASANIDDIRNFYRGGKFSYKSNPVTVTSGGTVSFTHGLAETPKDIRFYLLNETADANWSPGDFTQVAPYSNGLVSGTERGFAVTEQNSTTVSVRFANIANVFIILDKTTGADASADLSDWKFYMEAEV